MTSSAALGAISSLAAERAFVEYFRCPVELAEFSTAAAVPEGAADALAPLGLPFTFTDVVRNLREERYRQAPSAFERITGGSWFRHAYYLLRPLLPVGVRKHLQRIGLRGWERISFPRWPVDFSVEALMEQAMAQVLRDRGLARIPFIWFWPDGAKSCAMMTHDVEGRAGERFAHRLMDIDESFGIKSAFQIVPGRGSREDARFDAFRRRGFEVNLHDWNHDGSLFWDESRFREAAKRINAYARDFGCRGFRSGSMYRNQQWYGAFAIDYDMSVPNVAHLEPQRGGCCTVMPYFVGGVLELPLTTTQDYSLFHVLGQYSIDLWQKQIALIHSRHGLSSFITHPDYLIDGRAQAVYRQLLTHLSLLRDTAGVWIALPGEVATWWRSRDEMQLVPKGDSWRIEGPGSDRARLAFATLVDDRVVYTIQ